MGKTEKVENEKNTLQDKDYGEKMKNVENEKITTRQKTK